MQAIHQYNHPVEAQTQHGGRGHGRDRQAAWREIAASWLRRVADRVAGTTKSPSAVLDNLPTKVSHRDDVQEWFAELSPTTREATCGQARDARALLRIAHLLRHLPDEPTLLEFTRRVPDWAVLHKQFAAYLLRRLVTLRHLGREPDDGFAAVHRWLQRRQQCLTALPVRWYDAVDAAAHRVGEEAAVLLNSRTSTPSWCGRAAA